MAHPLPETRYGSTSYFLIHSTQVLVVERSRLDTRGRLILGDYPETMQDTFNAIQEWGKAFECPIVTTRDQARRAKEFEISICVFFIEHGHVTNWMNSAEAC